MNSVTIADIDKAMQYRDSRGKAAVFSITFTTANRKKKTGGEVKSYAHCSLYRLSNRKASEDISTEDPLISASERSTHIRRIQIMKRDELTGQYVPTGKIREVHLFLISYFNSFEVL